jgi:hypothetical protein
MGGCPLMCEDAPCCGCCGNDYGDIYAGEYGADDYYGDGFGPEDYDEEDEDEE